MKDERTFLHDISTPISTIFFLIEVTLENLQATNTNTEDVDRLNKAHESLVKLQGLLHARHQELLDQKAA